MNVPCPQCDGSGNVKVQTVGEMTLMLMAARGVGVRDVAKVTGLSPATVSRATTGGSVDLKTARALAEWCDLTPQQFWDMTTAPRTT